MLDVYKDILKVVMDWGLEMLYVDKIIDNFEEGGYFVIKYFIDCGYIEIVCLSGYFVKVVC